MPRFIATIVFDAVDQDKAALLLSEAATLVQGDAVSLTDVGNQVVHSRWVEGDPI